LAKDTFNKARGIRDRVIQRTAGVGR
jgi:hypothetical protein